MKFKTFCDYLSRVEVVDSRLEMRALTAELYGCLSPAEAKIASYLLQGEVAPRRETLEFHVSGRSIFNLLKKVLKRAKKVEIKDEKLEKSGNLGSFFEEVRSSKKLKNQQWVKIVNDTLKEVEKGGTSTQLEIFKTEYNHRPGKENNRQNSTGPVTIGMNLSDVYAVLMQLAQIEGKGAVQKRESLLLRLLGSCGPGEGKYIIRVILNKLRLGVREKTIVDALAYLEAQKRISGSSLQQETDNEASNSKRVTKDKKCEKLIVASFKEVKPVFEYAVGVCSDLGLIAQRYRAGGIRAIQAIEVELGIPIKSQLAEREDSLQKIVERIPDSIVQAKLDGLRCQIHIWEESSKGAANVHNEKNKRSDKARTKPRKEVRLFSRSGEDITHMFPEIVKEANSIKLKSAIFDSEIMGVSDSGEPLPFQKTITRKRKYDIKDTAGDVPVKAFVFDLMELNGKDLIKEKVTYDKRLKHTLGALNDDRGFAYTPGGIQGQISDCATSSERIVLGPTVVADSKSVLKKVFEECVDLGLEGVVVKDPNSAYSPGARPFDWIKYKRAQKKGLADTVDVAIVGYYYGRGKREKFGIGALLGAVFDHKEEKFKTVTKIGTGITDQQFVKIKKRCDEFKIKKAEAKDLVVAKELEPDVWVEPVIVSEVEADEITKSPSHSSGFALRFPRLKVFERDKKGETCTTLSELKGMAK